MAEVSYINPLSSEGREIIQKYGDLNQIFQEDDVLIDKVIHTTNQKISDDDVIPKSYKDLAIKRIQWAIEKKNNKNYIQGEFEYLLNEKLFVEDVVTFHILCQAIAIQFNIGSRETRLFIESLGKLIEERLTRIPPIIKTEIIDEVLNEVKIDGSIKWTSLKGIISSKKLSLTDLFIQNGDIILQEEDFLTNYSSKFNDRNPQRMYNILIGDSTQ